MTVIDYGFSKWSLYECRLVLRTSLSANPRGDEGFILALINELKKRKKAALVHDEDAVYYEGINQQYK